MPPKNPRSPTELAREISQATPKPKRKPPTLTQRCNTHEELLIEQGFAIDRTNQRIEGLAQIQQRTIAELQLLKHQQSDHADRHQLDALEQRLATLESTNSAAHGWIKQRLMERSQSATIVLSVLVSLLLSAVMIAVMRPKPTVIHRPQTPPQTMRIEI